MATTYTLISSVTVGAGGTATISFTSIPQTYTDLVLVTSTRTNRASNINDELNITFNSNTSSYTYRRLLGESTASSDSGSTRTVLIVNGSTSTASTFDNSSVYIPNYTGSNNKSFSVDSLMENNATAAARQLVAGLWSNSAAITQIDLTSSSSSNFVQYSTAYLYGISNE